MDMDRDVDMVTVMDVDRSDPLSGNVTSPEKNSFQILDVHVLYRCHGKCTRTSN